MTPPPITPTATRRIKSIAPLQCGKVLGILYGILGLLFVPFFLIMALVTPSLPPEQRGGMIVFGVGFALAAPVFYGVMGFVTGALGAVVYNLVTKWVGGIEVEVE